MIIKSSFKPAWWLTNPHAQTIYSSVKRSPKAPVDKVEQIELPDGDCLNLAWSTDNLPEDAPLVVILHGLSGCVNSSYVGRFMRAFNKKGWRAVLMHFRGAGDVLNRLPRAYHSGDTADLDFLIKLLNERQPQVKKAVVGVSLGGNVLLKWLGEQGADAKIDTAVAVSVPFVLRSIADKMNNGFSKIYQRRLLKQLKEMFARKMSQLSNPPAEVKKAAECQCFWTFDAEVTAPLHGFNNVHTYYRESSSRQFLKCITVPTLIIHSLDDPFMTPDVVPTENELSAAVTLELSKKGGHVGFVAGKTPGNAVYWLYKRVPEFLQERLGFN